MALSGATPTVPRNALQLKQLLELFDWQGETDKNSTGNAIADFYATMAKWVRGGGELLRGMEYTLVLDESAYVHRNDLHLFGQVLCEFLRSKTPATSFVSLVIILRPSGKTLKWEHKPGLF
jgi:type VI secretion system protein ImpG